MDIRREVLLAGLRAMLCAASDDEDRSHLCGVQIWGEDDKLRMSATDGHWCAFWTEVDSLVPHFDRVLLPRAQAEFMAVVLGAADCETVEFEAPALCVSSDTWSMSPRLNQDAYATMPDLYRLLRDAQRGDVPCIGVNPKLFGQVAKAFRLAGGLDANTPLELSFGGTIQSPIMITCEHVPSLVALLMPCTLGHPVEVREETGADGKRRTIRTDTGEVVNESEPDRQATIPGAFDPVAEAVDRFRDAATKMGCAVTVSADGREPVVIVPKEPDKGKRGKRSRSE